MANFNKGILGAFSGKVGNVVGASWRSLNIIRSLPKPSKKQATMAQLSQRQKFALINSFLKLGKALIDQYYGGRHPYKSRHNLCVSYHLKEAVMGTLDNYSIDYTKVVWTKGELMGLGNATLTPQANQIVELTFVGMSGQSNALDEDQVMLVLWNEGKGELPIYYSLAERVDGVGSISLPSSWQSDTVHAWVSVHNPERRLVATSQYLGTIVIL